MNRALFLDRDGIFNKVVFRDGSMHSPRNWDEVEHEEGLNTLKEIKAFGYKLILITNQPDIERQIIPLHFVEELHAYYQKEYGLDAVYVCPFSSNSHPDKKPNPGMLLRAAHDHQIDLKTSFFLGDTEKDQVASHRAGCQFILMRRPYNQTLETPLILHSLNEITKIITQ